MWRLAIAVAAGCAVERSESTPSCALVATRGDQDLVVTITGETQRPSWLLLELAALDDGVVIQRWTHEVAVGAFATHFSVLVADVPIAPIAALQAIDDRADQVACSVAPACSYSIGGDARHADVAVRGQCTGDATIVISLRTAEGDRLAGGAAVAVACAGGHFSLEQALPVDDDLIATVEMVTEASDVAVACAPE